MVNVLTQTSRTDRKRGPTRGRVQMMLCRMILTIRFRDRGTAWTLGNSMTCRTPAANIGKNHIDLDQQMLIVMKGCLLLNRWRRMTNSLEMMLQLDGRVQGPGESMMLMTRQKNRINRIDRINRSDWMLTPHQLWKPIDTEHHQEHVEHTEGKSLTGGSYFVVR